MPAVRSGIPTTYSGTNFRSRLEARWAAFFDLIGWEWVYEPLDASGYIPDFLITGKQPLFVEVGPCVTPEDYMAKSAKPAAVAAELGHDMLIVGVTPVQSPAVNGYSSPVAGLLGEFQNDVGEYWFEMSEWHRCHPCHPDNITCGGVAVSHQFGSYASRPCGHHDGDHHRGFLSGRSLREWWNTAGNTVQWRAA